MILRRLMEALHAHGVVCVMTSKCARQPLLPARSVAAHAPPPLRSCSRAPDELYKNGIQREQFMPCIELIKRSFFVQCLDSEIGPSLLSVPSPPNPACAPADKCWSPPARRLPQAPSRALARLLQPNRPLDPHRVRQALRRVVREPDPFGTRRRRPLPLGLGPPRAGPALDEPGRALYVCRPVRRRALGGRLPRDHKDVWAHLCERRAAVGARDQGPGEEVHPVCRRRV